ncbi:uncharacterized protein RJT21DRAFT_119324, partial [Scheffersomyces amazonensis]|uniref:uncharacterized protein n=1 Tax=Scheffersomyces amazonensis TaxID=1078765 RepID=UPI00315DE613
MTVNHTYELKLYQDKIRALESQLKNTKFINDKLSNRSTSSQPQLSPTQSKSPPPSSKFRLTSESRGKLAGFTIVTPTKKFV